MIIRPRRLRQNEQIRSLVRETSLEKQELIYPMFVIEGKGIKEEIAAMPGQYRYSVDMLPAAIKEVEEAGVGHVLLFGIPAPEAHDACGTPAFIKDGIVQRAIREIKDHSDIFITTDVCLCEYTDHGHCGILDANGYVNNDKTLEVLAKTALSHAEAGADMVAPSDMMDGRVAAIRAALDDNGFINTPIMSYAVKYASTYYGPFREAANSAPGKGNRKGYQMDYHNSREAEREAQLDLAEGADIIMVKPALAYLDIIAKLRNQVKTPLATYCVSGEYTMLQLAIQAGVVSPEIVYESHIAMKRAGADIIITYFAKDLARYLQEDK
jgi:porphobilinogen synthase